MISLSSGVLFIRFLDRSVDRCATISVLVQSEALSYHLFGMPHVTLCCGYNSLDRNHVVFHHVAHIQDMIFLMWASDIGDSCAPFEA